ncbi:hypothetical protein [Algibacter pectinivorans]|uniref:Pesticidal crystal protein Cry22Aa Ig-like domain-containing protein n=1 Tax=Algibacter pectinivorans TaxID=870482 RepID=A0A1I1MAF2_9FLAO|nr:hypothetical protein [Algibacter pectinivorans]SFC82447.1 hypothetical protein SAMN04487987_101139 [Algibacter pectinivorans]
MKKYKLILCTFSILGLILTSCDPSVESPGADDSSEVTFLPLIELEGADVVLDCDATSYSDPGAVASVAGEEIELNTKITGTYFGGTSIEGPDVYSVAYSAFNVDDIPATAFREVLWPECNGDLVTSIAGVYTASVARDGSSPDGYQDNGPFIIKDLGDDRYAFSDAQGGWYEFGRGLGPSYGTPGLILKANDISANDFTAEGTVTTNTFGGVNTFVSLKVNPDDKTLVLVVDWSFGFSFETVFTQTEIYY